MLNAMKLSGLNANEFWDSYISFSDLIKISRDKNIPISLPDHQFITADLTQIRQYFIKDTLWKKESHKNFKDWALTQKWIDTINKKIIPGIFSHLEDFLNVPLKEVFAKNEKLSKFSHIYELYQEHGKDKYSNTKYINNELEYIKFLNGMFDERDDNDSKEAKIIKSRKRELLNTTVALHEQTGEFDDIDKNYEEFQDIIKEIYDDLSDEYKNKIWFEDRQKSESTRIQKMLSKKSTNPMDTNTDDFWNRFVILEEDSEKKKTIKKILCDKITKRLIRYKNHIDQELQIANHGWCTDDWVIKNKQSQLNISWYKVELELKPSLTRFPTTKFEGKYIDQKHKDDKYPFEIQILDKEWALEHWRSARAFYHAKKNILQTARSYTRVSKERIKKYIQKGILYQAKCYQEDLKKIEQLKNNRALWAQKESFLHERYKEIKIPWSPMVIHFPQEWDQNISINWQLMDDKHLEEIAQWYIHYLVERAEITNFYPKSDWKKNKELTDSAYFMPIDNWFIKYIAWLDKFTLKGARVGWLSFLPDLYKALSEKGENFTPMERKGKEIIETLLGDRNKNDKDVRSKNIPSKAKKIAMSNLSLFYYLNLSIKWSFEEWELSKYKEYYEKNIVDAFNLQKTSS